MNAPTIKQATAGERRLERQPGIRPVSTLWRRLDAASRRAVPALTTLIAQLLLTFPLNLPLAPELRQGVALSSVFFWTVYRPNSMPPSVCFGVGMLSDLLGPEPPGLTSLVLLAVHGTALTRRLRLIRRGFAAVWLHFAGLALLAALGQWALTAILDLRVLPVLPALFAATLAIGLYPFLSVLLAEAHGTVAAPEQA